MEVRAGLALLTICVSGLTLAAVPQAQSNVAHDTRPPTVLFLCPHGAAKSVLASAYFQRVANERGLNVRVESAGTDPDPTVAPAIAAHLKKNGYEVPVATPRRVTAADMAAADVVISIGCDVKDLPPEVRGESLGAGALEDGDWRRVLEREVASRLARGESQIADPLTRDFESALITKALQHTGGRRIEAAGLLGIGRNTLTRKVQELKIDVKD